MIESTALKFSKYLLFEQAWNLNIDAHIHMYTDTNIYGRTGYGVQPRWLHDGHLGRNYYKRKDDEDTCAPWKNKDTLVISQSHTTVC